MVLPMKKEGGGDVDGMRQCCGYTKANILSASSRRLGIWGNPGKSGEIGGKLPFGVSGISGSGTSRALTPDKVSA